MAGLSLVVVSQAGIDRRLEKRAFKCEKAKVIMKSDDRACGRLSPVMIVLSSTFGEQFVATISWSEKLSQIEGGVKQYNNFLRTWA